MAAVCHDSRAEQNGRSIRCATLVLANWSQAATTLSLLKSLAFASDAPAGPCDVPAYYVNPTNNMRPAEGQQCQQKISRYQRPFDSAPRWNKGAQVQILPLRPTLSKNRPFFQNRLRHRFV
jgi:hypothetical protein